MSKQDFDLVSGISTDEISARRFKLACISPDDGKYAKTLLLETLSPHADQLALLEELGRFVSEETKALLHPGTTSYGILDTARAYLFKECWTQPCHLNACTW